MITKCDWGVDKQLEILKRDYLGMKYTVTFDKYHLDGIAEGLTITESMNFVDWDDACDWAGKVTMNTQVPYVILEMRGPNGEKEMF